MSAVQPANGRGRKGLKAAVISASVVLIAALAALALALSGLISIPGITQATGEIVLQGADEAGLDPFAEGLAGPAAGTAPQPVAKPIVTAGSNAVSGASVGLYGGTNDNSRCDPAQLISFLGSNPSKAQAWVTALNADPNLRWASGTLTTAEIPAYVATLTPLVLLTDTLVTNHGFVSGAPTPFSSVLQAGTAVLVDRFGVPRARCLCGNPLISAAPMPATPTVVGTPWPGFDITAVVVVQQTVVVNNVFVVVPYPGGGAPITVAAGNCVIGQPCPSPWSGSPATTPGATAAPTTPATATPTATAPTPAPTTPATWTPVPPVGAPASDPNLTASADITFVNNSVTPIDIYWIDFNGDPVFYTTLAPGDSYNQPTTEGHIWSITSGSSTPIVNQTAMAGSQTVTIS